MCREQGKLLKLDKGMAFYNTGHFPYLYRASIIYIMKWEMQGLQTRLKLQGQIRLCRFSRPDPYGPLVSGPEGWESSFARGIQCPMEGRGQGQLACEGLKKQCGKNRPKPDTGRP